MNICALGKSDLIGQHRSQHRRCRNRFFPKAFSRPGFRKTRNCTDTTGPGLFHGLKTLAVIDADLVRFFFPSFSRKKLFYFQASSGDLHVGQPGPFIVSGNLIDLSTEGFRIGGTFQKLFQAL